MHRGLNDFFRRHPAVRQAAVWALPAIGFGLVLRVFLLSYIPLAYWGSDSRSYFDFSFKLYVDHYLSLVEKRRFLYPIYVALVTMLPGTPLRWIAWLQHALGVATLIPIAYIIRKTCAGWKWWIIPITILYTGMPLLLWYEHELLAETVVFSMVAWAFAGWIAWAKEERVARAVRLWWLFLIPFATIILTKPSVRFFWPGIFLGLLYMRAWRKVSRAGIFATLALMVITLFVGSKKQGAWLLYTATFPLTQLNSPKHADYKAEIADKVRHHRERLAHYYREDDWAFSFLENPSKQTERPLWTALEAKPLIKAPLYMDLAVEGIKANPVEFLTLGLDRLIASANLSTFKEVRFTSDHYPERYRNDYQHAEVTIAQGNPSYEALALGLPIKGPLPSYPDLTKRLAPARDSFQERFVVAWVAAYETASDLVRWPAKRDHETLVRDARPTLLGYYLILGLLVTLAARYRTTFAPWMLAAVGYLCGVFLVSQVNPRYFGAAWPVLIPILALPADLLYAIILARWRRPNGPERE